MKRKRHRSERRAEWNQVPGVKTASGPVGPSKPDERERLARKHGTHRRDQYPMIHSAMDTATGDIRGIEFTSGRPIQRNGRPRKEDCHAARARNDILRASKRFGQCN